MNLLPRLKQNKKFIAFICVLVVLGAVVYTVNNYLDNRYIAGTASYDGYNYGLDANDESDAIGLAGNSTGLSMDQKVKSAPTTSVARAATTNSPLIEKKIIQNGTLSLFVDNPTDSIAEIKKITEQKNGFIENSQIYESTNGSQSGSIIIRIPAAKFSETFDQIKKSAKEVERESINSKDVTDQYIDLDAQLRNLRAEEKQYLDIMGRAQTINDTLSVASHLSDVRGRIERIQGQLQYLSRQIDMSTITISLTSYNAVKVFGLHWQPLYEIKKSFRSLLEGLSNYFNIIIRFIINLPVILLWLVTIAAVVFGGWKLLRWLYRRFF